MVSTASPGTSFSARLDRAHRAERFLVAMAVQQRALCPIGAERQARRRRARAARNSSNSMARAASQRASSVFSSAGISSRKPRMQLGSSPTTGTPRATKGVERRERALGFRARLRRPGRPTETCGRSRAAARRAVGRLRQMHAVAGGLEHRERGVEILALEIAVEGVGEQHDLAAVVPLGAPAVGSREHSPCATPAACAAR